jgi:glycosyltransferase involved in cell wall biosynthesis
MGLTMPYCYLATSFNYKSFVEKINKVLSLDITKNDIRIERANYLKKFDIRFTAPKYIEFYEALLNKQLISK